jgi:hypothetical protein
LFGPAKARLALRVKANTIRDVLLHRAILVGLRFIVISFCAARSVRGFLAGAVALIGFSENN